MVLCNYPKVHGNQFWLLPQQCKLERLYEYTPINGLPIATAVVFFIVAMIISYKIYRRYDILLKYKYYLYILTITCLAESMAYAFREWSIYDLTLASYAGFLVTVLLAPNALALVNYMTVGKIIGYSNISHSKYFKPKYVPRFFVLADLLCFGIQGVAGGMMTSTNIKTFQNGANLFTVGVILQLVFIASFIGVTAWSHYKVKQHNIDIYNRLSLTYKTLYATIILITIRTIYRTIEYEFAHYNNNYVTSHEVYFYMFDTLPILIAFIIYAIWHLIDTLPIQCLQASYLGQSYNDNDNNSNSNSNSDNKIYNTTVDDNDVSDIELQNSNNNIYSNNNNNNSIDITTVDMTKDKDSTNSYDRHSNSNSDDINTHKTSDDNISHV